MLELLLLNALLAARDTTALVRNGLMDASSWLTHKEVFLFIQKHLGEYGELPSVNTVIENTDNFEINTSVESIDTLCKKVIERNLKNAQKAWLTQVANKFGDMDGYDILAEMEASVEKFQKLSTKRGTGGMDWASNGAERASEYEERKKKDFSRRSPFMFPELTAALGELNAGDYEVIMAFTSKGKSWMGDLQALVANSAGLKVLIESGEMNKAQVAFRLDTLQGKFSNRGLATGALDCRTETEYMKWLSTFNSFSGKAPLVIKTQEDWPKGMTIQQIEHDIQVLKPDMVVVDQFSLVRHVSSDRMGMSDTSRRLKELAGKYGIIMVLLYQANGEYEKRKGKDSVEDNAVKELTPPKISDYSDTIAVIQDADVILTFDSTTWRDTATKQQCGKALMSVAKARNGGEGTELDLHWVPDVGLISVREATDAF